MEGIFLICPDCRIEGAIRDKYGDNSFFITALGSVFSLESFEVIEEFNALLTRQDITNIYIVNDTRCTFKESALMGKVRFETRAEIELNKIIIAEDKVFSTIKTTADKAIKLSELNIRRQAEKLIHAPFLNVKIAAGSLNLYGLIHDRNTKEFTEFKV